MNKLNLDYTPHPAQQQIHDSDARFIVLNHGVRFGGNRCALADGIEYFVECLGEGRPINMVPSVNWWLVEPSERTANLLWRELKHMFPSDLVADSSDEHKTIQTIGSGIIEVVSGANPDDLIGVGLDLVTINDASYFPDLETAWCNLEARLNGPGRGLKGMGGKGFILSSGKKSKYFKKMHDWGNPQISIYDPDFQSFTFTTWDNPAMAARRNEVNSRTGLTYENGLKQRIGTDRYRQDYLAEFV